MLKVELTLNSMCEVQDAQISTNKGNLVVAPAGVIFVENMPSYERATLTEHLIEVQAFISRVIAEVNRG